MPNDKLDKIATLEANIAKLIDERDRLHARLLDGAFDTHLSNSFATINRTIATCTAELRQLEKHSERSIKGYTVDGVIAFGRKLSDVEWQHVIKRVGELRAKRSVLA